MDTADILLTVHNLTIIRLNLHTRVQVISGTNPRAYDLLNRVSHRPAPAVLHLSYFFCRGI